MDATVCDDVVAASVAIDPLLSARIGDACSLVVLVLVVAVALLAMAAQVSPVHFAIVVFYSAVAINCDYVNAFACSFDHFQLKATSCNNSEEGGKRVMYVGQPLSSEYQQQFKYQQHSSA